jgi:hypothetical protein
VRLVVRDSVEIAMKIALAEVRLYPGGRVKSRQMEYELLHLVLHTEYAGIQHQWRPSQHTLCYALSMLPAAPCSAMRHAMQPTPELHPLQDGLRQGRCLQSATATCHQLRVPEAVRFVYFFCREEVCRDTCERP